MKDKANQLSTEAYKGVRDFYPEDMFIQNFIYQTMREVAESFGYQEYSASLLEPAELYLAKSGEEIINDQTYTFTDRGGREVTLRPEMTPTVARLVAARKRDLIFPLRWYSIPNLFRYEKPQKGRLREHWQLNVDIFGVSDISAEIEVISMTSDIMKKFGLVDTEFEIRLNSRGVMNYIINELLSLDDVAGHKIAKLIDKKNKISKEDFEKSVIELVPDKYEMFLTLLNSQNFEEFVSRLPKNLEIATQIDTIREVLAKLEKLGITNAIFDQTLMRGFDYYTGVVFEVYVKESKRSVFGGGRYDDLLTIFGGEKIPAFGFGMGDVMIKDILETAGKLPVYKSKTAIHLCVLNKEVQEYASDLAQTLRNAGINVSVDLSFKKIGDQIKNADKQKIPYVICLGEDEVKTGNLKLKNLNSGEEVLVTEETIAQELK